MNPDIMKNIVTGISVVLALASLGFLLIVFRPGAIRWIARGISTTWLARIVHLEHSADEIELWSLKSADAMLQLVKAYDWRVLQWSGFSTGVLTATLAFISAVVVEYFKNTIVIELRFKLWLTLLGALASFLVYLISQRRITVIKNQFLALYTLLRQTSGE